MKNNNLLIAAVVGTGIAFSSIFSVGSDIPTVQAASVLPDNHTIEQLKVEYLNSDKNTYSGYSIDVGDRKGTLLIRVDQPKTESNIEWQNWKIRQNKAVSFQLNSDLNNPYNLSTRISVFGSLEMYDYFKNEGYMKFSDFENPNFYAGLAIYLPKKYNTNGVYWFGGNSYALRESGQVKAYFFHNVDVVEESMKRVKTGGTFPLMNKVMWGKTELWKGQLGKVTIKKPVNLWKRLDNGNLQKVRELKVGDEYRVYRYLNEKNGLYGVGSGMFVELDTQKVLYETPSKRNLRLVKIMHGEE